jgi:glutathione S-transferase
VLGSCLQYGILTKALPERPEFAAYLKRLTARPALQRSFAKNQTLFAELHPTG